MTRRKTNHGPTRVRHRFTSLLGLGVMLAFVSGCQGTRGERYTYRNLPTALLAAQRDNVQTVDLTRLASTTSESDRIDNGDVLEVSIAAGLSIADKIAFPVRIADDGTADLPDVGRIPLAGMELEAAEAAIAAACIQKQIYRSPHVTVTMKHQRMNRVMVVGAVKQPGVYEVPRGRSDLLAALTAAGGLSEDAGSNVEIRNPATTGGPGGGPDLSAPPIAGVASDSVNPAAAWSTPHNVGKIQLVSQRVDLVSVAKSGNSTYEIADGGIVNVEKRDPEPVHVLGLVVRPNRYEFPIAEDLRVLDAIALAGGVASPVANKVYVIRRKSDTTGTAVIDLRISEAKRSASANIRLSPGDVVSVEETPATVLMHALQIVRFGISGSVPLLGL